MSPPRESPNRYLASRKAIHDLIDLLARTPDAKERAGHIDELCKRLQAGSWPAVWSLLSDDVLFDARLNGTVPPVARLVRLVRLAEEKGPAAGTSYVAQIPGLLIGLSPERVRALLTHIPPAMRGQLFDKDPGLRPQLSTMDHVRYLVERLRYPMTAPERNALLQELASRMSAVTDDQIWALIPAEIALRDPVWSLTPSQQRFKTLLSRVLAAHARERPSLIPVLVSELLTMPNADANAVLRTVPYEIFAVMHDLNPAVLQRRPITDRFEYLCRRLGEESTRGRERALAEELAALLTAPGADRFLASLPDSIADVEPIWSNLPANNRLAILARKLATHGSSAHEALIEEIERVLTDTREAELPTLLIRVPESILPTLAARNPSLRPLLPIEVHIVYLIDQLTRPRRRENTDDLLTELHDRLMGCAEQNIWRRLPDALLDKDTIRALAPPAIHVAFLARRLKASLRPVAGSVIEELQSVLQPLMGDELVSLLRSVPPNVVFTLHQYDPSLRRRLPPVARVEYLAQCLLDEAAISDRRALVAELLECIRDGGSSLWRHVPDGLIIDGELWAQVPARRRMTALVNLLHQPGPIDPEHSVRLMESALQDANAAEREAMIAMVPPAVQGHYRLVRFTLPPADQVDQLWPLLLTHGDQAWQWLSWQAKILCVYRIVKHDDSLERVRTVVEDDPRVQLALAVLLHRDGPRLRPANFRAIHARFQEHIVDLAWCSTDRVEMWPLLPRCLPRLLPYCEGKYFAATRPDRPQRATSAYCPRARGPCDVLNADRTPESYPQRRYGARLYPELWLDWRHWSLQELLGATNTAPALPDLRIPQEYTLRLAGWINRLNEIRARLQCTQCTTIMVPNMRYSMNLAAYNMTVASCPRRCDSNCNVYFNHCWACRYIIDSRESRIYHEDRHLCIKCGSGPQQSSKYTQGDICPNCGGEHLTPHLRRYRVYCCKVCSQEITLPPPHCMTGPRAGMRSGWGSEWADYADEPIRSGGSPPADSSVSGDELYYSTFVDDWAEYEEAAVEYYRENDLGA
jgi:hypothetical protein